MTNLAGTCLLVCAVLAGALCSCGSTPTPAGETNDAGGSAAIGRHCGWGIESPKDLSEAGIDTAVEGFERIPDTVAGTGVLELDEYAEDSQTGESLESDGLIRVHQRLWGRDGDRTELLVEVQQYDSPKDAQAAVERFVRPLRTANVLEDMQIKVSADGESWNVQRDATVDGHVFFQAPCGALRVYVHTLGLGADPAVVAEVAKRQLDALGADATIVTTA